MSQPRYIIPFSKGIIYGLTTLLSYLHGKTILAGPIAFGNSLTILLLKNGLLLTAGRAESGVLNVNHETYTNGHSGSLSLTIAELVEETSQ